MSRQYAVGSERQRIEQLFWHCEPAGRGNPINRFIPLDRHVATLLAMTTGKRKLLAMTA